MHKFIKTFYLWLGLFTFCNIVSFIVMPVSLLVPDERLLFFPVAWTLQIPLVFLFVFFHQGANRLSVFLPVKWKRPVRFLLCAVLAFFFMGMYAASQIMYQQIETFISWDVFHTGLKNLMQIVPDLLQGMGGELMAGFILSVLIGLVYTWRYHNNAFSHSPRVFTLLCAVFIASGSAGYVAVYKMDDERSGNIRQRMLPTTYLALSIIDDLLPNTSPAVDFLEGLVLEKQVPMEEYLQSFELPDENPHVFFIMLESVSWDRFGFTGYERTDITPNLNRLAADALVFPRTYATACHSNYSQTSAHASQYPLRRRQLDQFERVDYPKTMLADILSHAGYQTAFFSAQNEDWQGMRRFIHAHTDLQHFYHSKTELGDDIGIESKVDDETVRKRAIEFLETRMGNEPLFMYINFQASHFPYAIPENAPRPYQPCETDGFEYAFIKYDQAHLDTVINKFDNALRYVDAQVGALIDYLKHEGLYENSLIVVASDHGEAFYERGYPTHGTSLFEDQVRTVSLFKLPGSMKTGTRDDAISLIDLNPTILEVLGMKNHPNFQGVPVLEKERGSPIYLLSHSIIKSSGIVDYPWKYVSSEKDGEWLLNLAEDPSEWTDYSESCADILLDLKERLGRYQMRQLYYYNVLPQDERDRFYPPQH